jgi:hypothetical protein
MSCELSVVSYENFIRLRRTSVCGLQPEIPFREQRGEIYFVKERFISSWDSNYSILFNCGLRPIEIFTLLSSLPEREGGFVKYFACDLQPSRARGLTERPVPLMIEWIPIFIGIDRGVRPAGHKANFAGISTYAGIIQKEGGFSLRLNPPDESKNLNID